MGTPKYKNYPQESKAETKKRAKGDEHPDKPKVLELQQKIQDLLTNNENLDKAASIISNWISKRG